MTGPRLHLVGVLFSLVWTSAFIAGKIAVTELDPFTALALRFSVSALLMVPLVAWRPNGLFNRRTILVGGVLGLCNNVIYLGLTFSALKTLRPELVTVVVSCAPFMTAALAAWLGLERLDAVKLAGMALGIAGVVAMSGVMSAAAPDPLGLALVIAAAAALVAGTVLFRGKADGLSIVQVNVWQTAIAALALLPAATVAGGVPAMPSLPTGLAILYLAFVTIAGMGLWLVLIRASGAATAASYHLLNPAFGVLLSWLVLGTPLRPIDIAGVALIALGLWLVMRRPVGAPVPAAGTAEGG